mgnify:CR=1 FL=1
MNLDNLFILTGPASFTIGYIIGVNIEEYRDTKEWLLTHNIDRIYYFDKLKRDISDNRINKSAFYLGIIGRKVVYRKYNLYKNQQ